MMLVDGRLKWMFMSGAAYYKRVMMLEWWVVEVNVYVRCGLLQEGDDVGVMGGWSECLCQVWPTTRGWSGTRYQRLVAESSDAAWRHWDDDGLASSSDTPHRVRRRRFVSTRHFSSSSLLSSVVGSEKRLERLQFTADSIFDVNLSCTGSGTVMHLDLFVNFGGT